MLLTSVVYVGEIFLGQASWIRRQAAGDGSVLPHVQPAFVQHSPLMSSMFSKAQVVHRRNVNVKPRGQFFIVVVTHDVVCRDGMK